MPFLTDARCLDRNSDIDTQSQVCAGEIGQNKDTCQVIISLLKFFFWWIFKNFLFFNKVW